LLHLANGSLLEGWKENDVIKEDNIRWIFDELGYHFHSALGSRENTMWVLLLFYQFPLEVTFVTVVATGLLVSLSLSNPRRTRSTATPWKGKIDDAVNRVWENEQVGIYIFLGAYVLIFCVEDLERSQWEGRNRR